MVYNTENWVSLQKLPDKLATKLRKKKLKHEILFRNYSSRLSEFSVQSEQAELEK